MTSVEFAKHFTKNFVVELLSRRNLFFRKTKKKKAKRDKRRHCFRSFIQSFQLYYKKQREYFEKEKQKMKTGVEKLFEAAEQVQEITKELVSKEKHMAIANDEAAKVFSNDFDAKQNVSFVFQQVAEMEILQSAAEIKTKEVQESKETAEILVEQVNAEKAIAEEELSAAEIILKEAEEAVKVNEQKTRQIKENIEFRRFVELSRIERRELFDKERVQSFHFESLEQKNRFCNSFQRRFEFEHVKFEFHSIRDFVFH